MLTPAEAHEAILRKLRDYAHGRKSDVARGAETPQFAGVLLQKYGYGLCDAFYLVYGNVTGPTYHDVGVLMHEIDPRWSITQDERWAARPAGISLGR